MSRDNTTENGCQVGQSVERQTLEVEVHGSKPALGTGGRVGSHLTSPIQRDARSWMTRPWKLTLTTARFWITVPWK